MTAQTLTVDEAKFELALLNGDISEYSRIDAITDLTNIGVPQEIITRINPLWEKTTEIAGQVFNVGKIVVLQIIEFVKVNPNLAWGIALGTAIGLLMSSIPFIGQWLLPLSVAIGAIAGHRIDRELSGEKIAEGLIELGKDVIGIARKFFQLLINIFTALKPYFYKSF